MINTATATWRQAHLGVCLATFGLLAVSIAGLGYTAFQVIETQRVDRIIEREQNHLEGDKALIANALQLATKDVARLTVSANMRDFIALPSARNERQLERDFLLLAEGNRQYSQIRFLSPNGRERLRVENTDAGPVVVASSALQDKSTRPYVKAAQGLAPGSIYISPLDLNVENGEIERPLKPVLRFVQVVPDSNGGTGGLLILNYGAQAMLDLLRQRRDAEDISTVQFIDKHGHWILGPQPDME